MNADTPRSIPQPAAVAFARRVRAVETRDREAFLANIGTVYNRMPDGREIGAEGVFVYRVNSAGKLVSLKAYWDFEKTMGGG